MDVQVAGLSIACEAERRGRTLEDERRNGRPQVAGKRPAHEDSVLPRVA